MSRSAALRLLRMIQVLALVGMVTAVLWAGSFRAHGGHWERVETPSMGTTAPVGSLLWVEPTDFGSIQVGDFISFHPPGHREISYSHRVHAIDADGAISTKGEISGVDPWVIHRDDLIGRVTRVWPGVGWIVRATPVLVAGAVVTWGLCLLLGRRSFLPVAVVGASVTLALVVSIYRPITAAEQVAFAPSSTGAQAEASYVSTGLLDVRVQGASGEHVDLGPGEIGTVATRVEGDDGRAAVTLEAHLSWWFWALMMLGCFLPAIVSSVAGSEDRGPQHRGRTPSGPGARRRGGRRATDAAPTA